MIKNSYFAAGCFWGVEDKFQKLEGVKEAISGYSAGKTLNPTYKQVCKGDTGHAETVKVIYDDEKISFNRLCEFFFDMHNPCQINGQGVNIGSNYRSIAFYETIEEFEILENVKKIKQNTLKVKIVTEILPFKSFFEAEEYHQDYYSK
ncbi:peptide-methionine (S)-S-oxide reductase [bacterium]|nr:peptide-methionine (S)-S-oxide reductase [bacterium]|tara:strand:- start:2997 stop:3440 length:444 start_codon:yes stop_codon:yes gene_type:complete